MSKAFSPRTSILLQANVRCEQPPQFPELLYLNSPAIQIMTDFKYIKPVTVAMDVSIDNALMLMKKAGVRLLLVVDDEGELLGLITSYDIQGELPVKIVEECRIQRADITIERIMTHQPNVKVLDMRSVRDARVGHILETLHHLNCRHLPVVEKTETGKQRVCGLFSATDINKRLADGGAEDVPTAHSLAEMVHERVM